MSDEIKAGIVMQLRARGWVLNESHAHWFHQDGTRAVTYFSGDKIALVSGRFNYEELRLFSDWIILQ